MTGATTALAGGLASAWVGTPANTGPYLLDAFGRSATLDVLLGHEAAVAVSSYGGEFDAAGWHRATIETVTTASVRGPGHSTGRQHRERVIMDITRDESGDIIEVEGEGVWKLARDQDNQYLLATPDAVLKIHNQHDKVYVELCD